MQMLRTNKKVLAVVMAALFTAPTFGAIVTPSGDEKKEEVELNFEELDPFYKSTVTNTTFKIYDSNDNLVYETTLNKEEVPDIKLLKLLNQSDFLAENETISYFRLND